MEILTVKQICEEYGLTRPYVDTILSECRLLPRKPRGKKRVERTEFEAVLRGER